MDPLGGPGAALGAQLGQRVEGGAQPGNVRAQRGHRLGGRFEALRHPTGDQFDLGAAQRRGGQGPAEREVHLGGRTAESPRLPAEVVALGEHAQRQLPAVRGPLEIGLQHAEYERLGRRTRLVRLEPGDRRGHPPAALPGQRPRQLQVRVHPRHHTAEQFQDERISVHERRVGLLRAQSARNQAGRDVRAGVAPEPQLPEPPRQPQPLEQQLGDVRIVQPFVHRLPGQRSVRHVPDQRGREMRGQRLPDADQQLVAVGVRRAAVARRAGDLYGLMVLLRLHEKVDDARGRQRRLQQFGRGDQREAGDGPSLAGEPPLPRQPLTQQRIEGREQVGRRDGRRTPAGGGFRHGVASFPRAPTKMRVKCPGMRQMLCGCTGRVG
ncbi:hypothetical protein STSP_04640 [Streptomyces jeddahensis]|uniref:Uncharacterized protein n=1 Tax=Streptomyces jeddahensis TaxID=1716141 RepID=A0A177HZB8_9ACTN|nr:hypothetical protein STSP_04640 [Streptomyces jeddahensis]